MNWLTKAIKLGEKIKKVLRKRPSKEEIENSDWTSCCKGPILKKDLEDNLWVCSSCGKHHRKKTNQNCAVMIAKGVVNGIEITAGAINFDFIGGSCGAAESEAIIYGVQHAIDNQTP